MPQAINRDAVQKLIDGGAQVVEVLPSRVYQEGHLPGAVNIPLTKLDRTTTQQLARDNPVIVYCYDFL